MKKIIVGIGVVAIVVVLWFVITIEDRIKNHIEDTATYLAGVPVKIKSVEISMFGGTGKISGLTVENPKGFSKGNAFEMDSIRVELDPGAVFSQPLVINKLIFDSPVVNLEFKEDYRSNLQSIVNVSNKQNNVRDKNQNSKNSEDKKDGSGGQSDDQQDKDNPDQLDSQTNGEQFGEEDDFRMVFRQLNINNITLNAQRGTDKWTETVPELTLDNIGRENGIGTRELGITIVRELTSKALAQAAERSLSDIVEEKVKELGSKLLESLFKE